MTQKPQKRQVAFFALLLGVSLVLGETRLEASASALHASLSTDVIQLSPMGQLVPYSNEPLADQTPLILLHGIGGEDDQKFANWDRFLAYTDANPDFQKRFKVYLFRYDSQESVDRVAQVLRATLQMFIRSEHPKPFRVLAYSEGGLLYRQAMADPTVDRHTERLITIGTPHHGSPLASPTWMHAELQSGSRLSALRITERLSYWVAKKQYPTFENDFRWDNFDGAIPQADTSPIPAIRPNTPALPSFENRLITYGSYFDPNDTLATPLREELDLQHTMPEDQRQFRHVFSPKHLAIALVGKHMARLPLAFAHRGKPVEPNPAKAQPPTEGLLLSATDFSTLTPPPSMMAYNDGISPISSTLWLGRFFTPDLSKLPNPLAGLWQTLRQLKGTGRARLFPALDHRDWMIGEGRSGEKAVSDLLNPDDPPRTVFDWFLHDLMSPS